MCAPDNQQCHLLEIHNIQQECPNMKIHPVTKELFPIISKNNMAQAEGLQNKTASDMFSTC